MSSSAHSSAGSLTLREGLRLYPMADGSGVLADPRGDEAHALNTEATLLLSSSTTWSESSFAAELGASGASRDAASAQAAQFVEGLRALGVLREPDA